MVRPNLSQIVYTQLELSIFQTYVSGASIEM